MTLQQLWESKGYNYYPTDKGSLHSYLDEYQKLFEKWKDENINIVEIGSSSGGGLKLFEEWFTNANIIGFELFLSPNQVSFQRAKLFHQDATKITNDMFDSFKPTIVIDDASHILEHQLYVIETVFPQIVDGGILVVEDILDLEKSIPEFDKLNIPYEVIDLRNKKGRFDDVLIIFRK